MHPLFDKKHWLKLLFKICPVRAEPTNFCLTWELNPAWDSQHVNSPARNIPLQDFRAEDLTNSSMLNHSRDLDISWSGSLDSLALTAKSFSKGIDLLRVSLMRFGQVMWHSKDTRWYMVWCYRSSFINRQISGWSSAWDDLLVSRDRVQGADDEVLKPYSL